MQRRKLQDSFTNKVVTVLTHTTTLHFTDAAAHAQYFTGRFLEADDYGVWLQHLQTQALSFFGYGSLIGIVQEQALPPNDPRVKELQQKFAEQAKPKSSFVAVDELTAKLKSFGA